MCKAGRTLLFGLALIGIARANVIDWSMTLTPQSAVAGSDQTVDFQITFVNNSAQDILFSDFGDGQGITVDLEGNVIGNGACGPGLDCFVQSLFLTSADPIVLSAGSGGTTLVLGQLIIGAHPQGGQIIVVAKGGPDSDNGVFPNPAFFETTSAIPIVPEPSSIALLITGLLGLSLLRTLRGS